MDQDHLIPLLRAVQGRDGAAFERLVEETCEEAYLRCDGDWSRLVQTYNAISLHIDEWHPALGFWGWFQQIAGPQRTGSVPTAPGDLGKALLEELEPLQPPSTRMMLKSAALTWVGLAALPSFTLSVATLLATELELSPWSLIIPLASVTLVGLILWLLNLRTALVASWRPRLSSLVSTLVVVPLTLTLFRLLGFLGLQGQRFESLEALGGTKHFMEHPLQRVSNVAQSFDPLVGHPERVFLLLGLAWVTILLSRRLLKRNRWVTIRPTGPEARVLGIGLLLLSAWPYWCAFHVVRSADGLTYPQLRPPPNPNLPYAIHAFGPAQDQLFADALVQVSDSLNPTDIDRLWVLANLSEEGSPEDWERLRDISLQVLRGRNPLTSEVPYQIAYTERNHDGWHFAQTLGKPPLYLPSNFFTSRLFAGALGRDWREFSQHRETLLRAETPLSQEASRPLLGNPYLVTREQAEVATGQLYLFPCVLELRRLRALGRPQPRTLDEFPPEVLEVLKPYRSLVDWESDGVRGTFGAGDWWKSHTFEKGETWRNL